MKKFDYKEPEFKVVLTSAEDILTASEGGEGGGGSSDNPNEGFVMPIVPYVGG